jgi:hypothetical protein
MPMRELLEELLSRDKTRKVEIVRRSDGNLQVFLFQWFEDLVPGYDEKIAYWSELHIPATITDDIDRARHRPGAPTSSSRGARASGMSGVRSS